jgi:hypothetical protein
MDASLGFLTRAQKELFEDILARRNPALASRMQGSSPISRSDADEVVHALGDEITDNLDEAWEPTDYGRTVSEILAHINAVRIEEWPE